MQPGSDPVPGDAVTRPEGIPVLKNVNPIITGDLLRVLDSIQPGQSLAVASDNRLHEYLHLPPVQIPQVTVEEAVEAIFSVLPLASDGNPPLLGWFADSTDEHTEDLAYAVNGLATDAELRRVEMTTLTDPRDFGAAMTDTVATIVIPETTSPWAFLIRAGT